MLEPITISVPNLAARWNQTPSDILERAAALRLHLLFNFDGLAFDLNDAWLPGGKDARQRRELQSLTDFVMRAEAKFKRRVNGQLSQWESLDDDDAVSLRAQVTAKKQEIQDLNESFDDRDRQRQQKHYRGALRPTPGTVYQLLRLGFAKHPIQAYRPEGPFMLHTVDGVLVLDGPIVRLESAGVQWKERLETSDMVVRMADVKAIEAAAKSPQKAPANDSAPEQNTATPAPAPVPQLNLPWWQVTHDIPELWQNIGATLHSQQKSTSNIAIAKEVEKRINDIERSKGRNRKAPAWDTIRGLMTGWKWRA